MKRRAGVGALAVLALGAWLCLRTFSASPLPEPPPFAGTLPPAVPPLELSLVQLPTGVTHRSAGFAYRGGSFSERRDFAMAAALIRHPRGDVLVDTGFGRDIDAQFSLMPWPFRLTTSYTRGASASEQLAAAGYDRKRLRAILLTHAHWDHVSGIPEFPGTPVLVTAEERDFVRAGGAVTVVAAASRA